MSGARATASQTAGPYWHLIDHPEWADLLRADGPNAGLATSRIELAGRIADGAGSPVTDAMVEIWQADADGRYDGAFHGFGRCATDREGRYRFVTLRPGPVPAAGGGNGWQAPHVALSIFARGLLKPLVTRLYFAGEALNETDPLLAAIAEPERRATLIARPEGAARWVLDLRLQGEGETVFLEI
ncbi:protocatechuate 3,4-dioxygenase subunit alpha [Teichococcus aestuarii]|uniref:Protocatechuate 3,4-dioxygenase subunit alpha n=1 Tax=Teichococcus aestuarii TaxID=568898 RepID=A0A2U1V994_9PROT|nr:protocatechuate 3,4-dioxygenase subunit alpha [Pseudoroseomonas aestuarii]PWC30454.1 protocatechuate 3,4-dioxygenase subunit alpha [Pseudoroseomonas aestuarii]